jgi:hypothetical protein
MLFRKFMKSLLVGFLTSASLLVLTLFAQDHTVSSDASAALRAEWLDLVDHGGYSGLMRCLRALDEYTLPGNPDTALKELVSAAPAAAVPFYRLAQREGNLGELLATASKRVDPKNPEALNGTFSQADAAIAHLYDSKPEELDSGVNKVAAKSQSRALYNLLRLVADSAGLEKYLQPVGAAADSAASNAAQTMDLFRTCYRFDRNRLFRLVSKHFR